MLNGLTQLNKLFSIRVFNGTLGLIGLSFLTFIVFSTYIPYNISLESGDSVEETIVSPRFIEIETEKDKLKTENLRKRRVSLIEPVYSIDENINKNIRAQIVNFFTLAKQYISERQKNPTTPIPKELRFISKRTWLIISTLDSKTYASLEYIILQNMDQILSEGIKKISRTSLRQKVYKNTKILGLSKTTNSFVNQVILEFIQPNFVTDEAKTQALIQSEIDSIQAFTTIFKEGQPIIYSGETVTKDHIEILKALNIYGVQANIMNYFGIFICGILLFILFERFLFFFYKRLHSQFSVYASLFILSAIVILIARFLFDVKDLKYISSLRFLIPIPIVAMTTSLLFTPNVAMIAGTIVSIFIAIMYKGDLFLLIYLFLSTCIATFGCIKLFKRTELISSGNIVGLFNVIIVIGIGFMLEVNDLNWYLSNSALGFLNGLFSAMITLAILPYIENTFKITTSLNLLEQANINHPLLKQLMVTAPGTYQHSLMVANLCETAAEEIGADAILARIGAYFHDIGKMKRPLFFSENQFSGENPHDAIGARMSKIIIAAHAKDGVEIAEKYKLPKALHDFMLEHHGTTLVSFFYSQALQESDTEESITSKEDFRYPGPKPQSKEAGILMLADALEASVRSLEKPTPSKIENMMDKIIKDRIEDKQLDESGLTLNEIEKIRKSFLSLFKSVYHNRIDYQEEIAQIIEQTRFKKG
tara:strand:+ start:4240 stop:6354 length:2115 start_codon:yes stop_codon:yes gene_type:complete